MKSLQVLSPRQTVLEGTADFVVNLADLPNLTETEAREFLDSNVLTSGMELLVQQAFARMAGEKSASGIYKLSESMGGGKTQTMIVARGLWERSRSCATRRSPSWPRRACQIRPSWQSPVTSAGKCSITTPISGWQRSAALSKPWSRRPKLPFRLSKSKPQSSPIQSDRIRGLLGGLRHNPRHNRA
jgi:hypothetical protein